MKIATYFFRFYLNNETKWIMCRDVCQPSSVQNFVNFPLPGKIQSMLITSKLFDLQNFFILKEIFQSL